MVVRNSYTNIRSKSSLTISQNGNSILLNIQGCLVSALSHTFLYIYVFFLACLHTISAKTIVWLTQTGMRIKEGEVIEEARGRQKNQKYTQGRGFSL